MVGIAITAFFIYVGIENIKIFIHEFSVSSFANTPWLFIAFGILLVIISIFGLYAIFSGSKLALALVKLILTIIFCAESAACAWYFTSDVDSALMSYLSKIPTDYGGLSAEQLIFTQSVDGIQDFLHCCGENNYTDYANSHWRGNRTALLAPFSCCIKQTTDCNQFVDKIYTQGCFDVILSIFRRDSLFIYIALGFCVFIQIFDYLGTIFLLATSAVYD